MHFVAGTNERLTIPLLVHRVCEGFQKCIPSDRYLVVLHVDKDRKKSMFKEASLFLNAVGVNYTVWYGKFTADAKMMQSIDVLKSVGSESVVYHTGSVVLCVLLKLVVYDIDVPWFRFR